MWMYVRVREGGCVYVCVCVIVRVCMYMCTCVHMCMCVYTCGSFEIRNWKLRNWKLKVVPDFLLNNKTAKPKSVKA